MGVWPVGGLTSLEVARFSLPSRKKERGEFSPGAYRCRIDRPPGVEKLQQLLARAIVVPGPVAFDDFNELAGRLLAPVLCIEEDGEIESAPDGRQDWPRTFA